MKFFTPELYERFNSDDAQVADRADAEWEEALAGYRRRLKAIGGKLPAKIKHLASELCLHDANYVGFTLASPFSNREKDAVIVVEQCGQLFLLLYRLSKEPPSFSPPRDSKAFSRLVPHWLYDEVDCLGEGVFTHEILLSTGTVLKLQFSAFDLISVPTILNGQGSRGHSPAQRT